MNANCNRLVLHQEITTKNSGAHTCAHECLAAAEPKPTPREAASKKEKSANNDADTRDKNLERTIVIGAVLILLLVALVYYVRFADPGQPTDGYSTSTLQPITRY